LLACAIASTGRLLPTSYSVDGTRLTQTVDTAGAVGEVTADPHLVPHGPKIVRLPPSVQPPYLTLWLTRHETEEVYRRYRDTISTGQTAAAAFCGVLNGVAEFEGQPRPGAQQQHLLERRCQTTRNRCESARPPGLGTEDRDGRSAGTGLQRW
jgi:hypothetical protein